MSLFLISDQVIAKKNTNTTITTDSVEDISFQNVLDSNTKPISELGRETNLYYADNYDKPVPAVKEVDKPYLIPLLLIISLALVIVIMFLSNTIINGSKKKNTFVKPINQGNGGIELLNVINIDASKALYLIQYAGKKVLMAGSWNSFSLVSESIVLEDEVTFPKKTNRIPKTLENSEVLAVSSSLDFLANTIDEDVKSDNWESIAKANIRERKEEKAKDKVNSNKVNDILAPSKEEIKKVTSLEISTAEDSLFDEIELLVKAHQKPISKPSENKSVVENKIKEDTIPVLIEKEIAIKPENNKTITEEDKQCSQSNIGKENNEINDEKANLSLSSKLGSNSYKSPWLKEKELNRLNNISSEIKKLNSEKLNNTPTGSLNISQRDQDHKVETNKAESQFSGKYESKFGSKLETGSNFHKAKMFNTLNFQEKKSVSKAVEQPTEAATSNSKFIRENQEIIEKFKALQKEYENEKEARSINQNIASRKATTTIRKISMVEE